MDNSLDSADIRATSSCLQIADLHCRLPMSKLDVGICLCTVSLGTIDTSRTVISTEVVHKDAGTKKDT